MSFPNPWFPIGMAALALLVLTEVLEHRLGKWLSKPAASLCFVAASVSCGALGTTPGRWMFAGLILGTLGDILLIPKDKRIFLGGVGAFLLGHVAYVVAFLARGVDPAVFAGALVVLGIPAAFVFRWLAPHLQGFMRRAVVAYIVVITSMVAAAIAGTVRGASPWILFGAVLFYLSDLSVARDRFVKPSWVNRAWGLPAYYGGQWILACTAAWLVSPP